MVIVVLLLLLLLFGIRCSDSTPYNSCRMTVYINRSLVCARMCAITRTQGILTVTSQKDELQQQNHSACTIHDDGMRLPLCLVALSSSNMLVQLTDGSAETSARAATLRQKLLTKLAILPSHRLLAPGQPVPAMTLARQPLECPFSSHWCDSIWKNIYGESGNRPQACRSGRHRLTASNQVVVRDTGTLDEILAESARSREHLSPREPCV